MALPMLVRTRPYLLPTILSLTGLLGFFYPLALVAAMLLLAGALLLRALRGGKPGDERPRVGGAVEVLLSWLAVAGNRLEHALPLLADRLVRVGPGRESHRVPPRSRSRSGLAKRYRSA